MWLYCGEQLLHLVGPMSYSALVALLVVDYVVALTASFSEHTHPIIWLYITQS